MRITSWEILNVRCILFLKFAYIYSWGQQEIKLLNFSFFLLVTFKKPKLDIWNFQASYPFQIWVTGKHFQKVLDFCTWLLKFWIIHEILCSQNYILKTFTNIVEQFLLWNGWIKYFVLAILATSRAWVWIACGCGKYAYTNVMPFFYLICELLCMK